MPIIQGSGWIATEDVHRQAQKLLAMIPKVDQGGYLFGIIVAMLIAGGLSQEEIKETLSEGVDHCFKVLSEMVHPKH